MCPSGKNSQFVERVVPPRPVPQPLQEAAPRSGDRSHTYTSRELVQEPAAERPRCVCKEQVSFWHFLKLHGHDENAKCTISDSDLFPSRLQQDPSLLPSESSPDGSHQERRHHPHLLPPSPRHLGSPEASDCSTENERRGTGASTPEISVSSDSEFESWGSFSHELLNVGLLLKTFELAVDTLEVFSEGWRLRGDDL